MIGPTTHLFDYPDLGCAGCRVISPDGSSVSEPTVARLEAQDGPIGGHADTGEKISPLSKKPAKLLGVMSSGTIAGFGGD